MKLLYGTTNPAKLEHMQKMLEGMEIEIIGLRELEMLPDPVQEDGKCPLENARMKALAYYHATGMPTFSCDSGLHIEGLPEEAQPGVCVRRVGDRSLDDEEMIAYYAGLVRSMGREPVIQYRNAVCLVLDKDHIFEEDGDTLADFYRLTSEAHPGRKEGFPLDSLSLDLDTGKYILDGGDNGKHERELAEGFRRFFAGALAAAGFHQEKECCT